MEACPQSPLSRARGWGAAALCALAAGLLARDLDATRRAPTNGPEQQAALTELARTLAPLAELVPAGEALRWVRPTDSAGRPLFPEDGFLLLQAVLAPRPIGRENEARYLLADHRSPDGLRLVKGLEGTRVVAQLGPGYTLLEREGP